MQFALLVILLGAVACYVAALQAAHADVLAHVNETPGAGE